MNNKYEKCLERKITRNKLVLGGITYFNNS